MSVLRTPRKISPELQKVREQSKEMKKQEQEIIAKYNADVKDMKAKLAEKIKTKKIALANIAATRRNAYNIQRAISENIRRETAPVRRSIEAIRAGAEAKRLIRETKRADREARIAINAASRKAKADAIAERRALRLAIAERKANTRAEKERLKNEKIARRYARIDKLERAKRKLQKEIDLNEEIMNEEK